MADASSPSVFRRYWSAHAISWLGSAISMVALPLLVLEQTQSLAAMGLVTAGGGAGMVAAGPIAARLDTAGDRRWLLVACELIAMFALAAVLGVTPLGEAALIPIIAAAFVASTASGVAGIFATVVIVDLVPSATLTRANGQLMATYAVASTLGPMIAGVLAAQAGVGTAIAVDIGTFGISAALLAGAPMPAPPTAAARQRRSIVQGFRLLWQRRSLRLALLVVLPSAAVTMGAKDVFVYVVTASHGKASVGTFFAVAGVGALLGGVTAGKLRTRAGRWNPLWLALAVQGLAIAAFGPSVDSLGTLLILAAWYGVAAAVVRTFSATLRQEVTPADELVAVTAAYMTAVSVMAPLGGLVIPATAAVAGVTTTLTMVGLACLGCAGLAGWRGRGKGD